MTARKEVHRRASAESPIGRTSSIEDAIPLRAESQATRSSTKPWSSRSAARRGTPSMRTRWSAAPSCSRTASARASVCSWLAGGEKQKGSPGGRRGHRRRRGEWSRRSNGGCVDFDAVVATPDMMRAVGKPRQGARPRAEYDAEPGRPGHRQRPRSAKAVREIKAGKVEFRVDKTGIIHAPVGKIRRSRAMRSWPTRHALVESIVKAKPAAAKGNMHEEQRHLHRRRWGLGIRIVDTTTHIDVVVKH